ncbi:hypothetical protein AB0I39_26215 [Kitasatospora purpeofusca]|uniref:hypothetical protein n=1 Tax=Kitasatospora purpeofusca TaxID=67352 RepID=UPI0033FB259D
MSNTPPPHDHDLPYDPKDLGAVDGTSFSQSAAPDGRSVRVSGTCPRCHGGTGREYRRGTPGTGTKGLFDRLSGRSGGTAGPGPDPLHDEVHFCECGHGHPRIPAEVHFVGCGASWRIAP